MSLLDALRAGIKTADGITKPLQPTVSFKRGTPGDAYGAGSGSSTPLRAIVDFKTYQVRSKDGINSMTVRATITLLDIAAVVSATNGLGVRDVDIFVLPDGRTGPIVSLDGFVDAGTGHPIATTVMLG